VNKKILITACFISALLLSAVAGTQIVNLASANPYIYNCGTVTEVSPPAGTLPLSILISSPKNETAYASNDVSLTFDVSIQGSNLNPNNVNVIYSYVTEVYYRASWQQLRDTAVSLPSKSNNLQISINMTDVPEGSRWLEVYATAKVLTMDIVSYKLTGSSMVNFTIDTTPPIISALSVKNEAYSASNVTLNVIVNEPVSQVSYSVDGHEKENIAGNTTLTNLPYGEHNVTVYATDKAGNTGTSETIYFSVEEPFPTTLVAASVITVTIVSIGLLVYFKKRKRVVD
jgi:hypothetical protein